MKKILFILGVALVLILVSFFYFRSSVVPGEQNNGGGTLPIATPNEGEPNGTNNTSHEPIVQNEDDTLGLLTAHGARIEVKDFIDNGVTIPDNVNPGTYVLAGPLGYCLQDGSCPHGADVTGFSIVYDENFNQFNILLEEPLRANRVKVEDFLIATLGIERRDLCDLPYWIGTTSYINPTYAGQDLRFSFCPGAVALP